MPRKFRKTSMTSFKKVTSPFASSFKSGIKSGTPCGTVISSISKKTGKSVGTIVKSLNKAGLCWCQKFNGTWVCWPTFKCTTSASKWNTCQTNMWQCLVDWACMSGNIKTTQLRSKIGSQKSFMSACKSLFGKQVSSSTSSKTSRKSKRRSTSSKTRKTWSSPKTRWGKHTKTRTVRRPTYWSRSTSYKFPGSRTRRLSRAA
jgi:hypothetical protein